MKLLAFLKRDFLSEASYRVAFVFQIVGILFSVLAFYFVTKGRTLSDVLTRTRVVVRARPITAPPPAGVPAA